MNKKITIVYILLGGAEVKQGRAEEFILDDKLSIGWELIYRNRIEII